jgi:2-methylcitrate dehydratase PrpD
MPEVERDNTQDWLLPTAARPATMNELEQRVDVALATARSAEAAALEIGTAAFDAADQARRAAEFAERAVSGEYAPRPPVVENGGAIPKGRNGAADQDQRLRLFSERADRVMTRLRALEPVT